jgi:choline-sulfatase
MTRSVQGWLFFWLLMFAMFSVCYAEAGSERQKPNILMIAIDDQNDWIGCLGGHPQVQTPHIDELAQRGTVFLNAHCQAPLCNPSRTSLLLGRRPSSTGVYGLAPWFRNVPELAELVTLPQYLRQSGYRVMTAGKIFHGAYGARPSDDEFDLVGPPAGVGPRPKKNLVVSPSGHPLVDWGTFPHRDEDKPDWKIASWAIGQLEQNHEKPFFLSVGFFLPHVPCYSTQRWFDLYPEDSVQLPPFLASDREDTPRFSWYLHWKLPEPRLQFLQQNHQWKNLVRSYLACTSFTDSQVGRVLDGLRRSRYAENTIVVLWSDHGWHLGEKAITGKNSLWERSTRVPLIFAGPGVTAGGRCKSPAELLDIYPTLAEMSRSELSTAGLEGHSLTPQLRDPMAKREFPAITTHNHDNHSVRSARWRYIRYADGAEELYDMEQDPNEWHNLASEQGYSEILIEHRRWVPEKSRALVSGSRDRILEYDPDSGVVRWEGQTVRPEDPIPDH